MTSPTDLQSLIATYEAERPAPYSLPEAPVSRYVTMRDGCRIAVDVYLPQGAEDGARFPTLLLFTPYFRRFKLKPGSREIPNPNTGKFSTYFVPRGYAVVVIDVRGTGASFGTRDGFRSPKERLDSAEIADWVIAQDWSNGELGATGISYLGAASDFLASTGHPAVKAIAPLFSVWDTYSDNYFPGGMQCTSLTQLYDNLMKGLDLDQRAYLKGYKYYASPDYLGPQPVDEDEDGTLVVEAVAEHQGNFRQTDFMADFSYREEGLPYDADYSSASISPYAYCKGVKEDVAILSVSGWMDGAGYANGAIARFLTLDKNPRHLVLGPWDHGARIDVSPWRATEDPSFSLLGCVLRFFDTYLMGKDTGLRDEPLVNYYKVHEEAWGAAETWPPQPDQMVMQPTKALGLSSEQDAGTVSYQTVPETGTGFETRYERIAGMDSRNYYCDWQGRSDLMLSFDSAPLTEDTTLAGHGLLELTTTFDAADAGLFVYLTEVEADGTERYITEGVLRALFRKEADTPDTIRINWPFRTYRRDSATPLTPGTQEVIRIPLLPTAWTLSKGSTLRLSIAGADKDHFKKVPHGKMPKIDVDLAGTRLVLPLANRQGRMSVAAANSRQEAFELLLTQLRQVTQVTAATALRYTPEGAERIYSSHPAHFAATGFKRYDAAPTLDRARQSTVPVLTCGRAALQAGFADWDAILATGSDAIVNIPVRGPAGAPLGQLNLMGSFDGFSEQKCQKLQTLADSHAAHFLPVE